MAYELILDLNMVPYQVGQALAYPSGTRQIIIDLGATQSPTPVERFSCRFFLWFNPAIAGFGFSKWYFAYKPLYLTRNAFNIFFPQRWGVELMRLPAGDPQTMRARVFYE